jgi:hypothetical protein
MALGLRNILFVPILAAALLPVAPRMGRGPSACLHRCRHIAGGG